MTISERIFQRMEEKKLTQKEFSQATGISQSTICDWRRKGTNPASDKIMIICHCLDMDPVDLLSGAENKKFVQPDYLIADISDLRAPMIALAWENRAYDRHHTIDGGNLTHRDDIIIYVFHRHRTIVKSDVICTSQNHHILRSKCQDVLSETT